MTMHTSPRGVHLLIDYETTTEWKTDTTVHATVADAMAYLQETVR